MSESSKTKTKAKAKAKGKQPETKGQDGQLSCLNAAAKVLAEKGEPMNKKQLAGEFHRYACVAILPNMLARGAARFFAENVLSCLSRAQHPLLANARWEREINRVDVVALEQLRVTATGQGRRPQGYRRCAFLNKALGAGSIPAGHSNQPRVAGVVNGLPVFAGDICRTQNSPATKGL